MIWRIYHNPRCSKSRAVLAALREAGKEPEVVDYLKTPPSREELATLAARSGLGARGLLRRKGAPYDELGLDDPSITDERLVALMVEHPALIERPIVVAGERVALCRPPEKLQELLGS